jgi:hypothetical protein
MELWIRIGIIQLWTQKMVEEYSKIDKEGGQARRLANKWGSGPSYRGGGFTVLRRLASSRISCQAAGLAVKQQD